MRKDSHGQPLASRDEPRVNIHDIKNGRFDPFATASVRDEENANKIFGKEKKCPEMQTTYIV
jgi:hypothetical protein